MVFKAGKYTFNLDDRTHFMGIVNITPDSFSDGGNYFDTDKAIEQGIRLWNEGADIIDVGGESTRPGANPVTVKEELNRVIPVIEALNKQNIPVSIDTYKSIVAAEAVEAGACIINDISGLNFDPEIANVASKKKCGLIVMHIKGTPRNMQVNPTYDDCIAEIKEYLSNSLNRAFMAGVEHGCVAIDPGIGFGKTLKHNLIILQRLNDFKSMGFPLLIGVSRKSFIGHILNQTVDNRLYGTIGACVVSVINGADILRVHDVKQIREAVMIADAIQMGINVNAGETE